VKRDTIFIEEKIEKTKVFDFTYPEDEKTVSSSLVEKIMTTVKM